MSASLSKHQLFAEVKKLSIEDQLFFLHELQLLTEKKGDRKKPAAMLTSLSGLGGEVWKNIDIDHYVDEERQW